MSWADLRTSLTPELEDGQGGEGVCRLEPESWGGVQLRVLIARDTKIASNTIIVEAWMIMIVFEVLP